MSYIYNLTDTWNASGTTFAGIKMAVTNTASGASSKLLDLSVSGATTGSFTVDRSGNASLSGALTLGTQLSVVNGGTGLTSLTAGYIPFGAGTSALGSSANLVWDNTNARIGISKSVPTYTIDVVGPSLAAALNSTSSLQRYFISTGNNDEIEFFARRNAASPTNWTTADFILRRNVDATAAQQSFRFNGDGSTAINYGATEVFRASSAGNVGVGVTSFGTSAAKVLSLGTGTAPTTGPADTVQIYSTDLSAGNTMLSLFTEGTVVGTGTPTANRTVAIRVNGTVYYLLASTVP